MRTIYYWYQEGYQFWLFTIYDKDELDDLTAEQKQALKSRLHRELAAQEEK